MNKLNKTEEEWRQQLSPEEFRITREKGTEPPFTGALLDNKGEGVYRCKCCGEPLFSSEHKYDSGSGWPSFYAPAKDDVIAEEQDSSLLMQRTEILCSQCDAHLGHVFNDGPAPTGLRYCVNSASLTFDKDDQQEA